MPAAAGQCGQARSRSRALPIFFAVACAVLLLALLRDSGSQAFIKSQSPRPTDAGPEQALLTRRLLAAQGLLASLGSPSAAWAARRMTKTEMEKDSMFFKVEQPDTSSIPKIPGIQYPEDPRVAAEKQRIAAEAAKRPYFRVVRPTGLEEVKLFAFNLPKIDGVNWAQQDEAGKGGLFSGGKETKIATAKFRARLAGNKDPAVTISAYRVAAEGVRELRELNYTQQAKNAATRGFKKYLPQVGLVRDEVGSSFDTLEYKLVERDPQTQDFLAHCFSRVYLNEVSGKKDIIININIPENQLEENRYVVEKVFESFKPNPPIEEKNDAADEDLKIV